MAWELEWEMEWGMAWELEREMEWGMAWELEREIRGRLVTAGSHRLYAWLVVKPVATPFTHSGQL